MEFLKMLDNPPKTILTTAYSEYALESYDYGVVDYLLKPISFPRFFKAVQRFLSYNTVLSPQEEEPKSISIRMDGRIIEVKLSQIDFIQSFGNYVKIVTPTNFFNSKHHPTNSHTGASIKVCPYPQILHCFDQ